MKLICDGLDLAEATSKVVKALPNRVISPILECVKLVAKNNTLTIFATDLELSIQKTIRADVMIEGEVIVSGKFFSDFIRKLNNEKIELALIDGQMRIKYTDSVSTTKCLNINEYPTNQEAKSDNPIIIKQTALKDMITKTIFAASTDDARPVLKGSLFEASEDVLTAVALDGFRIAIATKKLEKKLDKNITAIIPSRSLIELTKLLGDNDDTISLYIDANKFYAIIDGTILTTRLITGEYLNYKQIVPKEFATSAVVNRVQFDNAIDRASVVGRGEKNNFVKIEIKERVLTLNSSSEIGEINEKIAVSLEGKDITIAFNSKYIADCLRVLNCEFVKISMNNSIAPTIIKPCGSDDCMFVVLPVRLLS